MDTLLFFVKGVAAGFVIAAPVGPVGALCVRRTLARGVTAGYATGLGAAIADTFYGIIAVYGLTFITGLLLDNQFWFRLIGGGVLCVLAVKTYLVGPAERRTSASETMTGDFFSALLITGTNPVTLVAFGMVFAAIGVFAAGEELEWAEALIVGVFVGSSLWWATLTGISSVFRAALGSGGLRGVNRVSSAVILVSGIVVLIGALAPDSFVARLFDLPFG